MLLDRLLDLEKTPQARAYGEAEYDLRKFAAFLESLGSPQQGQLFLHVAGTKGKGSTAAMMEGLLRGIGFPTALFSSPHLSHYGERFRFDGESWSLPRFEAALEGFYNRLGPEQRRGYDEPLPYRTVFETLTAVALMEFASRSRALRESGAARPQVVCWETGLGGRLDCTNVVDPVVSVITPIALDHTKILGDTIERIAAEKAGIIKPGRPVVVGRQPDEFAERIWPVILERAAAVGAPVVRAWEHNPVIAFEQRDDGEWVRVRRPDGREEEGLLPLLGKFQHGNLEAALAAVWYLLKHQGINPTGVDLLAGLPLIAWPGRFEVLKRPDGKLLFLDGAHCPYSAKVLGKETIRHGGLKERRTLLFSMQKDKDAAAFLNSLLQGMASAAPQSAHIYRIPGLRGADPKTLGKIADDQGFIPHVYETPEEAFAAAATDADAIMACGTLYTLALFKKLWAELPAGDFDARS